MRALALLLVLGACGGGSSSSAAIGESRGRPDERPIELALRRPTGEWIHVGDLRGRPVLLFVFATFDGVSQAALQPITRFLRHHRDVHVLGIAAQPDAPQLLDPYENALRPPFFLTYDPEGNVALGTSVLGSIDAIPTFLMLDARGFEVERHVGFPGTRTLERMRDRAMSRGGVREDSPAPLLGERP
ncbi:MAG: TlpA family protein disulfide reductase [Sandaracinus sp.]|nr:TlpA family protein disulfide reductase [Sandaracinus sp.]MCB9614700.1 TlpA family protein disulfide reductase [Sandaracinus sp.]MCB9632328.1 TlpA family protein disulfide reductase [Sandaracinus sp.]